MSKAKKVAVIVAISCIAAGIAITTAVMAVVNFDFSRLSTTRYETVTHQVEEPFDHIDIQADCGVRLLPAEDGECKVVCAETEKITHTVRVENNALVVRRNDNRPWYQRIGFDWGDASITVYLPERAYQDLTLNGGSGGITVPEGFGFHRANVSTASGAIHFAGTVENSLTAKTTSGALSVSNQAGGELIVQSTSGNITLTNSKVRALQANCTSGNIDLTSVTAEKNISVVCTSGNVKAEGVTGGTIAGKSQSGKIHFANVTVKGDMVLETTSGDIWLEESDASHLQIQSTSGNVNGTLLSEKIFIPRTTSGTIDVPDSAPSAGICEITTTSGDIRLSVA